MDQSYSLFTLIFKGVHEPFGFDSLVIAYFFKEFTNASHFGFYTGWSIDSIASANF